jgi:neutral amino acid transport system permease protein
MVVSIGLALVVRYLFLILFGSRPDFYLDYRLQSTVTIGPVTLTPKSWAIIVVGGAVLLVVGWALKNTRIGTAMRAVSVNKDLAESSGIDVRRVVNMTWLVGAALAGLSGVFFGLAESVRWDMGNDVLLLIFAAVVLGGLGTAYGAMVGGLIVGLVTQLSTYWFPSELKLMFALVVLVLILIVRPQGILGVKERFG